MISNIRARPAAIFRSGVTYELAPLVGSSSRSLGVHSRQERAKEKCHGAGGGGGGRMMNKRESARARESSRAEEEEESSEGGRGRNRGTISPEGTSCAVCPLHTNAFPIAVHWGHQGYHGTEDRRLANFKGRL